MMIKPNPLSKDDTVALIAPASPTDSNLMDKCIESIKKLGLNVVLGNSCFAKHGFLSGIDDIRANDINEMFKNKNIKGIFSLRGGYGSARLLDLLDFKMIKKNPKVFVGYSDITALHIALNQKCNLITYHGPMISTELIKGLDEYSNYYYEQNIFNTTVLGPIKNPTDMNVDILCEGYAEGKLIGGNLSVICSTIGTKYEINTKNKILFIEEVSESPYKIDRMLLQLHQAGKFNDAKGIVLGAFTDCNASDPNKSLSLNEVFNEIILPNKKPTIYNVACGHCLPTLTLPLGAKASLNTELKEFKVLE